MPQPLKAQASFKLTASSTEKRTIAGRIATYGDIGYTSAGPAIYSAGALELPDDLKTVKLLTQHDDHSAALGYMTDAQHSDEGIDATFYLPEGDDADKALAAAANGTRDGLSVGAMLKEYNWDDHDTLLVSAAEIYEVSLVTIPAYKGARVASVTAAQNLPESPDKENEMDKDKAPEAKPEAPKTMNAAQVIAPDAITDMTLAKVSAAFADGYKKGQPVQALTAALNDIIPADDAGESSIMRPQWIGELWQASRAVRPFFDKVAPKNLTNLKVQGWQVDLDNTTLTIDPYDGNKTEIPDSGVLKTKAVSADVVRRAGGWDVDRAFVDLGDGSFITETLAVALDKYKRDTEAWLVDQLLAAATLVTAGETFATTLAGLGVAATKLGARLDVIAMSADTYLAFASLKESEVPWWLRSQGELSLGSTSGTAGGMTFVCNPELPDGTILAVDSRGYTTYEKGPIKVQAIDIANGGIDLGVFSYIAAIVNDARAVLKVEQAPAALTPGENVTPGEDVVPEGKK